MKKIGLIIGVFLLILGLYQGGKYVVDYSFLSSYGKGFVWGSLLLIIVGSILVFLSIRKKREINRFNKNIS